MRSVNIVSTIYIFHDSRMLIYTVSPDVLELFGRVYNYLKKPQINDHIFE